MCVTFTVRFSNFKLLCLDMTDKTNQPEQLLGTADDSVKSAQNKVWDSRFFCWSLVAALNCFMWCRTAWLWLLAVCLFMLPQARSTRGQLISMSGYCSYRRKATVWAVSSVLCSINHIISKGTGVKKATLNKSTVSGSIKISMPFLCLINITHVEFISAAQFNFQIIIRNK